MVGGAGLGYSLISIARIMDMNRHVFDLLELKKENLGSLTDSLTHRLAHCMTH